MKRFPCFLLCIAMFLGAAHTALAQQSQAEIDFFHRRVVDSCIFDFRTDERLKRAPDELAGVLCGCVDEWLRYNHLDSEEAIKENEEPIKQVALTCFERAINR